MPEERCPNCEAFLHGPYCSDCGQRRPRPEDYSTFGFLIDVVTEIFSAGITLEEYATEFNRKEEILRKGLIAAAVFQLIVGYRMLLFFGTYLIT